MSKETPTSIVDKKRSNVEVIRRMGYELEVVLTTKKKKRKLEYLRRIMRDDR